MNITIGIKSFLAAALIMAGATAAGAQQAPSTPVPQCLAPNSPVGTARGIHPGRVAWSHAPGAARWDGGEGFWFADSCNDQGACDWLVAETVTNLTGEKTPAAA